MSSSAQDSDLEIGLRRFGRILVCYGDDCPDTFAPWLEKLVSQFSELLTIAEEHGINLNIEDNLASVQSEIDFCERIGIEFDAKHWEGSVISGIYRIEWIKAGTVRAVQSQAQKLIGELSTSLDKSVRNLILNELKQIKSLDLFLSRTKDDRQLLNAQIKDLTKLLDATKSALDDALAKIELLGNNDSKLIDAACHATGSQAYRGW